MSEITWIVLSDGRYIKVLYQSSSDSNLLVLKSDDHECYAELCYEVASGRAPGNDSVVFSSERYIRLQADFLEEQMRVGSYHRLVLVAPSLVLEALREALSDKVIALIAGELAEDLLSASNDMIEKRLATEINV